MKIPWTVDVEKLSGDNNFRTMFRVGVQGFTVAHAEDIDEAETHCQGIAKMFRQAMMNAGYCNTPASEDWALDQLTQIGTLVGSRNTAEALIDVRALVVEVANGTGPLAEECKKRLALADECKKRPALADVHHEVIPVVVQVNGKVCGTVLVSKDANVVRLLIGKKEP
jgi:hypothetical protein